MRKVFFFSLVLACAGCTLVKPLKTADVLMERAYRDMLQNSLEFRLLPISLSILERAASLRALHGLKTPDAIHAASALEAGCVLLVTNDPVFKRVPGLPVEVLSDL